MLKGADVILYLNWKPTWTLDADQKGSRPWLLCWIFNSGLSWITMSMAITVQTALSVFVDTLLC